MIKNKIEKRDYQVECLNKIKKHRDGGAKSALINLATGLGKTFIAVQDVEQFIKDSGRVGVRVLFCAHIRDILEEAKDEFARALPNVTVDFKTIQSLYRNLDKIKSSKYDYIIYDEAHHGMADTHKKVIKHFKPKFKLGLTATPYRADGLDISDLFGEVVYSMSLPEGLVKGYLAGLDYQVVFDQSVREAIMKDFNPTSVVELRKLMNVTPRNEEIVKNILEEKERIGLSGVQTIVFCQSVKHAQEMAILLRGKAYYSDLSRSAKERIFNDFRMGLLETICTVDMFNEGVNIPEARLLVFLRSTSSRTVFLQQLGRGLRKIKGKDKVSVLDFAANIERLENIEQLAQGTVLEGLGGVLGTDNSPSRFSNYSFVFSKHVMEVMAKLHLLTETIPPDYISLAEISSKYRVSRGVVGDICRKHRLVIKKFMKTDGLGKGNGGRIEAISLHDFRVIKGKHSVFFAPEYVKNSGMYTVMDIVDIMKSDETTVRRRLGILGFNIQMVKLGKKPVFSINEEQFKLYKETYPAVKDPKGFIPLSDAVERVAVRCGVSPSYVRRHAKSYIDGLGLKHYEFTSNSGFRSTDRLRAMSLEEFEDFSKFFINYYIKDFSEKRDSRGFKSVARKSGRIVYESKCKLNRERGISEHIGTFNSEEDAHKAYIGARREYIKWKLGV